MMASSASGAAAAASMSSASSSSSNSPCAACKFLRRKCQADCVFAPYFPPDNPHKFIHVHKVFGASNVTKLLNELSPYQREDAVNSLAYEAEMRLRDPVYGCVGIISILQSQLHKLQIELTVARSELSKYQTSSAASLGVVGHELVNVNIVDHPMSSAGVGIGFGSEQFFAAGNHNIQNQMVLRGGYDSEMAARLGVGGSAYEIGFMAAAGIMQHQFSKPGSTAGGDAL